MTFASDVGSDPAGNLFRTATGGIPAMSAQDVKIGRDDDRLVKAPILNRLAQFIELGTNHIDRTIKGLIFW
jgi:hypothetical protein